MTILCGKQDEIFLQNSHEDNICPNLIYDKSEVFPQGLDNTLREGNYK